MAKQRDQTPLIPKVKPAVVEVDLNKWIPLGRRSRLLKNYGVGETIWDYEVVRLCASGAQNWVAVCQARFDGSLYVMKTVKSAYSTQIGAQRLLEEFRRMNQIPIHPNVLPIYSAFLLDDVPHIVMEYAKGVREDERDYGCSLEDLIENGWKFSFLDALWVAVSVCRGLAHIRRYIPDFVHGDIKPGNILFQPLGSQTICDTGLCRYQVMVADFGGGKTYYVSPPDAPATPEDDIYAFAKTMEQIVKAAAGAMDCQKVSYYYWERFIQGLRDMLESPNSGQLRKELEFSSLYSGYAEALETILSHLNLFCAAEDVLPRTGQEIRAEVVHTINSCVIDMGIRADPAGAREKLLRLLEKSETASLYFDEMPVRLLIRLYLVQIYERERQWDAFDRTVSEIKAWIRQIGKPIVYKGFYRYSTDLKTSIEVIEQLAAIERGIPVRTDLLLSAVRLDVDCGEWLDLFLYYIRKNEPGTMEKIRQRVHSLPVPKREEERLRYHEILGTYLWFFEDYKYACPHYQFLCQAQPDGLLFIFRYAACFYSTGALLASMMYFERVYEIYEMNGAYNNPDWSTVMMGLLSLLYMGDYVCLDGHCHMISTSRLSALDEASQVWLAEMAEIINQNRGLMDMWQKIRMVFLLEQKEEDLQAVIHYKKRAERLLYHEVPTPYGNRYRAAAQVYLSSATLLARFYAERENYRAAIQECGDILRLDHTHYEGYQIRGACHMALWRRLRQEEERTAARRDFEMAEKYVYAMYPAKQGQISLKAEEQTAKLHKMQVELEKD